MITIPLLSLLIFFIFYQKTNRWKFGIISLLIFTYLGTSFLGTILYYSNLLIPVYEVSFISMFYLTTLIVLTLIGFSTYKDHKIDSIKISNIKLLKFLEKFLLYSSIFSMLFFLPYAFKAFQGDINLNRRYLTETITSLGNYGLINSFASLFANLFMLTQMFFFLNLIPINGTINKKRSFIMLLASMSYIIYILAYVGRDGVAFWLMSFLFQYLFFKNFIDSDITKAIKKKVLVFAIIMFIPFISISIARFQESPLGVYLEIINYMGQQLINFNDQFHINAPLQFGNINFPEFSNFLRNIGFDIPEKMLSQEFTSYYLVNQVRPNTFSTFIGSFLMDFGKFGTSAITILLILLTHQLTKHSIRNKSFPISNYILFILLFQNVYFGVFYFRLYSQNFYIIAIVIIYFIFKIKIKNKKSLVLNKTYLVNKNSEDYFTLGE